MLGFNLLVTMGTLLKICNSALNYFYVARYDEICQFSHGRPTSSATLWPLGQSGYVMIRMRNDRAYYNRAELRNPFGQRAEVYL